MLSYIIIGITYGFIAGVQPGPLQTYIISQTLRKGWRSTLSAAFAPIISDGPIFILVLFLLSSVPNNFIFVLRFLGGMYLLYLSFVTYKSWEKFDLNENGSTSPDRKSLLSAVIVNLLNPNPYLGWSLVLGPLFLEGWKSSPAFGVSLVIGFYLSIVFFLGTTIVLFGFVRNLGANIRKTLLGLSCIALLGFSIYQLWVVLNSLL